MAKRQTTTNQQHEWIWLSIPQSSGFSMAKKPVAIPWDIVNFCFLTKPQRYYECISPSSVYASLIAKSLHNDCDHIDHWCGTHSTKLVLEQKEIVHSHPYPSYWMNIGTFVRFLLSMSRSSTRDEYFVFIRPYVTNTTANASLLSQPVHSHGVSWAPAR